MRGTDELATELERLLIRTGIGIHVRFVPVCLSAGKSSRFGPFLAIHRVMSDPVARNNQASPGNQRKIMIVGAGIAGLCAGVYARKNGFDAEIVEMGHTTGGLATSWKRQDYTFENCLHWLLGSHPESSWHTLWKEVFDIDALRFIDPEDFARIEIEGGAALTIPRNSSRLERALLKFAPEDALAIKRLVRGIKRLEKCELSPPGPLSWQSLAQAIKMAPFLPELRFWSRLTSRELGGWFRHPLLREFFGGGSQGRMSAIALIFSMAWMSRKDAGYPIGGSRAVIDSIEARFRSLGGTIRFGSKVDRILTDGNRAVGVHLADGQELRSDWVISAADGHGTVFGLLPSRFRDPRLTAPYKTIPTFPSYLQISLGIRRDLSELPGYFIRVLRDALVVDSETALRQVAFRVFNFDPTFAPRGKTAVTCFLPTYNSDYWSRLEAKDPTSYQKRKKEVTDSVIQILENRLPGLRDAIEEVDVSTPATVRRYTGNWKGSMEGFLPTPKTGFRPLRMEARGLKNFMMIGQWVMPGGGLPSGLMTGRLGIQKICKVEARSFSTLDPAEVQRRRRLLAG